MTPRVSQTELARQMRLFLDELPPSAELEMTKSDSYLYEFEAARLLIILDLLARSGIRPETQLDVLDFGYLHGLTPEFLHRFHPNARFTVYDRPDGPIFSDPRYLEVIKRRSYLKLLPGDINNLPETKDRYRVILLGEIIEHLDPTRVAAVLARLRRLIRPEGVLIITTPNAGGLYNSYMTMTGARAVVDAPIPHRVMGYGHIHLWTGAVLRQTAEYCGWKFADIRFYHGREGEMFADARTRWISLKSQVFLKTLKLLAEKFPKLRGFLVASFVAEAGSDGAPKSRTEVEP